MIISVKTFLSYVEAIAAEEPSYRIGGYGSDGTCDCIGLIIGAIRRAGGSWTGTHGSNYAARYEIDDLQEIKNSGDLQIGDAVLKAHNPGEDGYDAETISRKYANHPDQRDYYHIGVVMSVAPLRIRHMTTPKPKMDTSLGKWKYHGQLKKIGNSIESGETEMEEITLRGGNENTTINLRAGPDTSRVIIADIPQGSKAQLLSVVNERWCKIKFGTKSGYVMSKFVHRQNHGDQDPVPAEPVTGNVQVPRTDLEKVYDTIGDWLGLRG